MKDGDVSIIKAYLIPILVLIIVVLIIPLVLVPQLDRIRDKNIEVKQGRERLENLNRKIADLTLVDENEESLKLIEVEKALPASKKLAPLIVGINNLAVESSLSVEEMEFKPGKVATSSATPSAISKSAKAKLNADGSTKDDEGSLTFIVKLNGKFADIKKFFSKLEVAKRLLGINTVNSSFNEELKEHKFELEIAAPFEPISSEGDVLGQPLPAYTSAYESTFNFIISKLKDYTTKKLKNVPTGVKNPFKD